MPSHLLRKSQPMAAATFPSSELESKLNKFLSFDETKNQFKWNGSIAQLSQFISRRLEIPVDKELFQNPNNGSCSVLKTATVTFNFWSKSKTLQVQGKLTEEMKSSLAEIANSQALQDSQSDAEEEIYSYQDDSDLQILQSETDKQVVGEKSCEILQSETFKQVVGEKSCEIQGAADSQSCIVGVPRGCSKLIETEIKRARQDFQRQFDSFRQEIRNGLCLPPEFESTEVRTNLVEENKGLRERLKELESRYEVLLQESTKIKEENKSLITVIHLLNTQDSSKSSKPVSEEKKSESDLEAPWERVKSQRKGAKKKAKKSKQPTKNRLNTGTNSLGGTTKEPQRSSEEESIDNSNKRTKAKVTVILGDSIVKNIQGHKLGKAVSYRVVVKPFPGATTEDMRHYIKPTLDKSPDQILLHVGTNDLKNLQPNEVADKVADLARAVDKTSTTIELTTRGDSRKLCEGRQQETETTLFGK